ncbi:MAG: NYN domain-containing protein [Desulfarculus sp.]|nr:NYN domain-containing protein [Desulfarculus sp.]
MKKVAVLMDGAYVRYTLYRYVDGPANDSHLERYARNCVKDNEELFRIYYYDCLPFEEQRFHPISRTYIDFKQTDAYRKSLNLIQNLETKDYFAVRLGTLAFKDWRLTGHAFNRLCEAAVDGNPVEPLAPTDLQPDFTQKGVDMKIGLDIAWLSTKHLVDKIILTTNDSDFIPAMKFARREGIHVVLMQLGEVGNMLKAHADEVRGFDIEYVVTGERGGGNYRPQKY